MNSSQRFSLDDEDDNSQQLQQQKKKTSSKVDDPQKTRTKRVELEEQEVSDEELFNRMLTKPSQQQTGSNNSPSTTQSSKTRKSTAATTRRAASPPKQKKPKIHSPVITAVDPEEKDELNEEEEEEEEEQNEEASEDEVFDLQDQEELEEDQRRKIPRNQTHKNESASKGQFQSNRIKYDNHRDFQEAVVAGPTTNWKDLNDLRPPTIPVYSDLEKQNRLYESVTNYIRQRNTDKDTISKDVLYDFIVLVAGFSNTLARRMGAPSPFDAGKINNMSGRDSGMAAITTGGTSVTVPPTPPKTPLGAFVVPPPPLATPPQNVNNNNTNSNNASPNLESASGPRKTVREKIADIQYLKNFNSLPNDQQAKILQDEYRDRDLEMHRQYLKWIDQDIVTGLSEMSELVYASMKSMWLQITTTMPHLRGVPLMAFIQDEQMRILFAEITGLKVGIERFLNPSRTQLDRNYKRLRGELHALIQQLLNYHFNRSTMRFEVTIGESIYGRIPGAPPSPYEMGSLPTASNYLNSYSNISIGGGRLMDTFFS